MMANQTYLVDSDVFITAKNLYYSFDICPAFGRVWFITTGRAESSASTGFVANYSQVAGRRIWSGG